MSQASGISAVGKPKAENSNWWSRNKWAFGSVFTGLALWEFSARFLVGSKLFLAAPTQVIWALGPLWNSGELQSLGIFQPVLSAFSSGC